MSAAHAGITMPILREQIAEMLMEQSDAQAIERRVHQLRTVAPIRAQFKVIYEVRKRGAIGVFEHGQFSVDAFTIAGAAEVARAEAHRDGYEVRFPISVARVTQ